MSLVNQINTHKHLYLDKLVEINDLELELWINEARVAQDNNLSENITAYDAIETDEFCKSYKITIKNYITYCVLNESYIQDSESEEFVGNLFRNYSKSKFLNYVSETMSIGYVEELLNEKTKHFQIICLNHIIDIICFEDFLIEEINN